MKLSVVIPVFNENRTIHEIVAKVSSVPVEKEIILVDDGSTDGTREIIRSEFGSRPDIVIIFHEANHGKGRAVRTGIAAATGELLIIQDADMEYDPMDYVPMVRALEERGSDVVFGSRFLSGKKVTSAFHRLVNGALTTATNILFGARLTDMETCYKLFRAGVIRSLSLNSDGFEVEAEITGKLLKAKVVITEVPVSYQGRNYEQGKKITWVDGIKTLWMLIQLKFTR
jgi:glycosyltransferase involved in cell wall biosynthesis